MKERLVIFIRLDVHEPCEFRESRVLTARPELIAPGICETLADTLVAVASFTCNVRAALGFLRAMAEMPRQALVRWHRRSMSARFLSVARMVGTCRIVPVSQRILAAAGAGTRSMSVRHEFEGLSPISLQGDSVRLMMRPGDCIVDRGNLA